MLAEQILESGGLPTREFGPQQSELHRIHGAVLGWFVGRGEHGFEVGVAVEQPGSLCGFDFCRRDCITMSAPRPE